MLIKTTYHDVPSKLDPNGNKIRIFVISPNIPGYPHAKFPGNWCHTLFEVPSSLMDTWRRRRFQVRVIILHVQLLDRSNTLRTSEIYQVTGPVERFAGQIASQGYVVGAKNTY